MANSVARVSFSRFVIIDIWIGEIAGKSIR